MNKTNKMNLKCKFNQWNQLQKLKIILKDRKTKENNKQDKHRLISKN